MPLFPVEHMSLASSATPEEILARLQASVEPAAWLRNPFSRAHKPFQGELNGRDFKIRRIIHYRNSFLPTVMGSVRASESGSVVEATLRLHPLIVAFMAVWFGGATTFFVAFLVLALSGRGPAALVLAPLGLFLFGYALVHVGFRFENGEARRFVEELAAPPRSG